MDGRWLGCGMGWGFAAVDEEACGRPNRRAAAGRGVCPLRVSQGAKRNDPARVMPVEGVSVGLDWVRVTADASLLDQLREWAVERFGAAVDGEYRGMYFYRCRQDYGLGVRLLWSHASASSVCVELPGSVLASFSGDERVVMLRELLELGCVPTRLDGAVDVVAPGVDLVERLAASCEAGNLCGARRWKPDHEFDAEGNASQLMVRIGRRGNEGSGRYVRAYDKGLEQGRERNVWQRLETEFADSVAEQVGGVLAVCGDGWVRELARMVAGSFDLRSGDRSQRVETRRRVRWWGDFVSRLDVVCVRAVRVLSTAAGKLAHLRRAVAPTLVALVRESGVSSSLVLRSLCRGVSRAAVRRQVDGGRCREVLELAGLAKRGGVVCAT